MDIHKLTKPYFLINPDYEGCLGYFSADNCSYGCDVDTLELDGFEDTPFIVPGLEAWCWEWNDNSLKLIHGEGTDFNWDNWHKRGLAFVQMLRQLVPDNIEIVYRKGTEDILLEKVTNFYLGPDTTFIIGDCNLYSVDYFGDEAQIGHFLPIPLPGLDKWWHDFDNHVDYVNSSADPTFDWASWTEKGWELVRIIRAHLPESVVVEYRSGFEIGEVFPIKPLRVNMDGSFTILT